MDIIKYGQNIPDGMAVALGAFDGVHMGHKKLTENVVEYAKKNKCKSCVFTFDKLPHASYFINSIEERAKIFDDLGIDVLFVKDFDNEFKNTSDIDFLNKFLIKSKYVTVGFNFKFGRNRTGNSGLLREFCDKNSIDCDIINPVLCDNNIVSSSLIRKYISDGNFASASKMLGRPFYISGKVVHGNKIGRKMGFPTANIIIDSKRIMPPKGVYITVTEYNGKLYRSITNYGAKPTFNDDNVLVETNIFDFNKDIYGNNIIIYFKEKIRDISAFSSADELKNTLNSDRDKCLKFFSKNGLQI
ncbi:MAG: bifunctional riboflavin kinase/FAD synthetase [Clostridia bacterium]|nr:bifunctional riboflavin kinase/FAD synthetase [Clostridia bacterium]